MATFLSHRGDLLLDSAMVCYFAIHWWRKYFPHRGDLLLDTTMARLFLGKLTDALFRASWRTFPRYDYGILPLDKTSVRILRTSRQQHSRYEGEWLFIDTLTQEILTDTMTSGIAATYFPIRRRALYFSIRREVLLDYYTTPSRIASRDNAG